MKRFTLCIFTFFCIHGISPSAFAASLEGEELATYNSYCPTGNFRAVWAEPLQRHLTGWVYLVCLNEDLQETSYWYVTPDENVQAAEHTVLPDSTVAQSLISSELASVIETMAADASIVLRLDFKYIEPDLTPEQFGAPEGVTGGSTGSAGSDVPAETTYILNGEMVSQAEYEAWDNLHKQALRDMNTERDRLIKQQVQLALYELVDVNQWHSWLDIDAVNEDRSEQAIWLYTRTLIIKLNGEQARGLLQTGPEFLNKVEKYYEPTPDSGDGVIPTSPQLGVLNSDQVEPEPNASTESAKADNTNQTDESVFSDNTPAAASLATENNGGLGGSCWAWLSLLLLASLFNALNRAPAKTRFRMPD